MGHPLGEVATVLAARGLRVAFLHEFPFTLFARWPALERCADGTYRFRAGTADLPLLYSLLAVKE